MPQTTIALIAFLFPLAYSPGPGNLFFAAVGARYGLRATWPASAGYHLATWLVTCAVGFGLAQALITFPRALAVLQIAGALYILYLALQFWKAGAANAEAHMTHTGFGAGALLLLLNPKAYLIMALMFTQFLPGQETPGAAAVIWISTIFTLNNLLAFTLWSALGDQLARRFRQPDSARRLNRLFGSSLGVVALWMLLA